MDIITHKIDELIEIPKDYCVFDIETTGLTPKFYKTILVGILYIKDNQTILQQFFANNSKEEKELLFHFKEKFAEFKGHISFNGIAFDIPFLNERFIKNELDFFINKEDDVDLLKLVRPHQKALKLENCKLKTVEKLIGIEREDTISGKDSVELYKRYEKTQDSELRRKILLHNYEDIYYLAKLYKIRDIIDKSSNFTELSLFDMPNKVSLNSQKIKSDNLILTYSTLKKLDFDIEIYEDSYSVLGSGNKIELKLNISRGIDEYGQEIFYFEDKVLKDDFKLIGEEIINGIL